MNFINLLTLFGALLLLRCDPLIASYQCGIRKHDFAQLVHRGWQVEQGQWPWHAAIFHRQSNETLRYVCGGSLLSEKHLLTAAHCVTHRKTKLPLPLEVFRVHLGQQNLSAGVGVGDRVQIRDVGKMHVHPEYTTHRNDIALLVMRLAVVYTDFVIPICVDRKVDRDLRSLEGHRGWVTGWGTTELGNGSDVLRTASLPVVSYLNCTANDPGLFASLVSENVFCAGDLNGTSPGTGDSGGGMYFSDGDRWVLRGVVSFAKVDERRQEVDTSKYAVFVNVQRFLTWIKEAMAEDAPEQVVTTKRISERECERFKGLAEKRKNGACENARHPHTVFINYRPDTVGYCTGVLVHESYVLSTCLCARFSEPVKIQIEAHPDVAIVGVHCHPQYNQSLRTNDLAVLKLNGTVRLSGNVLPACLASNWTENLYDTLVQTGYGFNSSSNENTFFESDENRVLAEQLCRRVTRHPEVLCVHNSDPRRSGLYGALGSPLQSVNRRSCMSTVVGLLSFVIQDPNGPRGRSIVDGYTRTARHLDWIEQVVWNEDIQVTTKERNNVGVAEVRTSETTATSTTSVPFNADFVFPDQLKRMKSSQN